MRFPITCIIISVFAYQSTGRGLVPEGYSFPVSFSISGSLINNVPYNYIISILPGLAEFNFTLEIEATVVIHDFFGPPGPVTTIVTSSIGMLLCNILSAFISVPSSSAESNNAKIPV